MLREIVAFEWRYHARQISFLAATILFAGLGFALTATGYGPANVHVNSPYSIAQSIGLLSLASIFLASVFSANAIARDREFRMEEIVFSTAITKFQYLFGRFFGSFAAAFTAFSACALGMFLALFLTPHDATRIGAVHVGDYLWALLVIALPNVLIAAALLFSVATLTRSLIASSVAAVFLYVLYFVGATLTNSPLMAASAPGRNNGSSLGVLLDPFGISAFFEQTRYWTHAVRDTQLIALSGNFLLNRLIVIGAAFLILIVLYNVFAFRVVSGKRAKTAIRSEVVAPRTYKPQPVRSAPWAAYTSATRLEVRSLMRSIPFLLLLLLWAALAGSQIVSAVANAEYGAALIPTSGIVFSDLQQPLYLMGIVLLIYYSTEILWRERTVRIAPLIDTTPASSAVFVMAKTTALAAMVLMLIVVEIIVAAILGTHLRPGVVAAFAYFDATPLIFFAIAAVVIHSFVRNKYVGMFALLVFFFVRDRALDHHLWRFGAAPPVSYSDMNGFSITAAPFNWYTLHWAIASALLLLIVIGMRERLYKPALITLSALFLASCGFIYYNTNVLNERFDVREWRADYEKQYKGLQALPQPRIVAVKATVDIEPRAYRIRGSYTLANQTQRPVTQIVAVSRDTTFSMPDRLLDAHDGRYGQIIFQLKQPLMPGAATTLYFDVHIVHQGFADSNPDFTVVDNGSFLMSDRAFPTIGYRTNYELRDPVERRKRGLPEREEESESDIEPQTWAEVDLTVSTPPDQTAVTSGHLVREWSSNGRKYAHFQSNGLMPDGFAIVAARYAVAQDGRVALYYHAPHEANVARMLKAASESLRYYESNFGPYPYGDVKIVEVPAQWNVAGMARPGVLYLGEVRAFQIDARDPNRLDLVTRRVAHELGHQWWGLHVTPALGEGATTITESLTKYSELMILEHMYGSGAVQQSLERERDLYLSGRAAETRTEMPLARAGNDSYLYYRKGAIVMYALKELLGESAMNRALRDFLQEQGGPGKQPTTAQLIAHLKSVANGEQQKLIDKWMTGTTLADLPAIRP